MGRHSKPPRRRASSALVTASGAIAAVPLTQGIAHADSADWSQVRDGIATCESGNRPTAHNPSSSASGLFQLLTGTWLANGGGQYARTAAQATPAQQEIVAARLFARSGTAPWNASRSCWRHKVGKPTTRTVAAPKHAATPQSRTYTVKAGDSLSAIAQTTGHTWQELLAANRASIANPNLINVGLTISLP